jgi:emp24/gp25L/p24 family/GOLD
MAGPLRLSSQLYYFNLSFHSESVTLSAFVLSGPELRAAVLWDGPLPEYGEPILSGADLLTATRKMESGTHHHHHTPFMQEVDFEHLNIGEDDEYETDEDAEDVSDAELTSEQRRDKRAAQRKKALEKRQRQEKRKVEQRNRVRLEGEPFVQTFKAPDRGWYRYCVRAVWNPVTVEMDLRKESEMGGLAEDGHVRTIQQKAMMEEEKYMDEDSAAQEGIKDEDFEATREKLKTLRRLLADIQSKQSQERHRLAIHSATNEHSHSHMVLGSLLETILFMAVTGYQVYTIRKWFKGAPVLGR